MVVIFVNVYLEDVYNNIITYLKLTNLEVDSNNITV